MERQERAEPAFGLKVKVYDVSHSQHEKDRLIGGFQLPLRYYTQARSHDMWFELLTPAR